jgi:threonine dehydratase
MTPLDKFDSVYLKREDLNLTGSVKDRATSLQVDHLMKSGFRSAVISSTGNAAISAQYFCQQYNVPLTIFVSPNIDPSKLKLLKNYQLSPKPISSAFKFAKHNNSYLLRQSTDPIALIGYQQISQELIEQLPQITSLFLPIASGTTLLGISQKLPSTVKIFAVQPASYCPISSVFDSDYTFENSSVTDALSAKFLPLKSKVVSAIRNSNGSGVVVQNSDVIKCCQIFTGVSNESGLAYAGYLKARNIFPVGDFPVILVTGSKR